jgi:5-oxoprolinase (ATP-hydrolysing)
VISSELSADTGNICRLILSLPMELSIGSIISIFAGEAAPILGSRWITGAKLVGILPVERFVLATTLATNALLEGKGYRPDVLLTAGFEDLLLIGDQRRRELFGLNLSPQPELAREVKGGGPRLLLEKVSSEFSLDASPFLPDFSEDTVPLVISLLHGSAHPECEEAVAEHYRRRTTRPVIVASELTRQSGYLRRTRTAVVEGTLSPILSRYLSDIADKAPAARIQVLTSAGARVDQAHYRAIDSLLSGPAGGANGCLALVRQAGLSRALTFDMGGTSTDVSRIEDRLTLTPVHAVAGIELAAPAVNLDTVAAGGGSICRVNRGLLEVGPESAGSFPGPACYGQGGPLTLTDVNVLLGRIDPTNFNLPLDLEAGRAALEAVAAEVGLSVELTASGFLELAEERMAAAMRNLAVRQGYDPSRYPLICFGGAGGLHACGIAQRLEADEVLFPRDAGLLSARGLVYAVPERILRREVGQLWDSVTETLAGKLKALRNEASEALKAAEGVESGVLSSSVWVRLWGQEASIELVDPDLKKLEETFSQRFQEIFGYVLPEPNLEIVAIAVRASASPPSLENESFNLTSPAQSDGQVRTWIDEKSGWRRMPVYQRNRLEAGATLQGPALIQDHFATFFLQGGWGAVVGSALTLKVRRFVESNSTEPQLMGREIFLQRFREVVEEMGSQLERTSLSTNVRDRLDFSCALLDAKGNLVANAPHVPVHLGALSHCVRQVVAAHPLEEGDCIVTNHPAWGGSHLPDITVISPVFWPNTGEIIAYVANRAHHAEIGGRRPGSLVPDATCLADEGVVIPPFYLLRKGRADWSGLQAIFETAPWPSRRWAENRADLEAQLAANQSGVDALLRLATLAGPADLTAQFSFLQSWVGEACQLSWQRRIPMGQHLSGRAQMDDGSDILVELWHTPSGNLEVDFSSSLRRHPGNLNATPAIVHSALAYVLRLLMTEDAPLNEGLFHNVVVRIEPSFLNPEFEDDPAKCPAVMGGNVETSQMVVEALVGALGVLAGGPGTMNNLVFGDATRSYYETLGSGAPASAEGAGRDGVHCHMTNTAITDAEFLEQRYPVILRKFALRHGSGGGGQRPGGDGLIREWEFREALQVGWLAQRRLSGPPGRAGGGDGAAGRTLWSPAGTGNWEILPGTGQRDAVVGDRLRIETPGGGAWGPPLSLL